MAAENDPRSRPAPAYVELNVNMFNPAPLGCRPKTFRFRQGEGQILPLPLPNSRTSGRSEAGETAIESSQRAVLKGIKKRL